MTKLRSLRAHASASECIVTPADGPWLVTDLRVTNGKRELLLDGRSPMAVRRFAPVGKGDAVTRVGESLYVQLRKADKRVQLTPAWETSTKLSVPTDIPVVVKEIETADELNGYQRLTEYHYRGNGGVGRRVPLIACVDTWELPPVVGFIELASSFLVNTARTRVLDTRFSGLLAGSRLDTVEGDTS